MGQEWSLHAIGCQQFIFTAHTALIDAAEGTLTNNNITSSLHMASVVEFKTKAENTSFCLTKWKHAQTELTRSPFPSRK